MRKNELMRQIEELKKELDELEKELDEIIENEEFEKLELEKALFNVPGFLLNYR